MQTLRYLRPAHFPLPLDGAVFPPVVLVRDFLGFRQILKIRIHRARHSFYIFRTTISQNDPRKSERTTRRKVVHVLSDEKHERATSPYLPTFIFEHADQNSGQPVPTRQRAQFSHPFRHRREGELQPIHLVGSWWCVVFPVFIGDCSVFKLLPDDGPRHERPTAIQLKSRNEKTYQLRL